MSSSSRVLLGCVLACSAGALVIAFGAPGILGAAVTAVVVVGTVVVRRGSGNPYGEPWRPVRIATQAGLFAVALTIGAAMVAYTANREPPPAQRISSSVEPDPDPPASSAPGATLSPALRTPRSSAKPPTTSPSPLEEALTPDAAAEPTGTASDVPDEPDEPSRPAKPGPTRSPDPSPAPPPSPSPSPSPSPTEGDGLGDLIGDIFPSPKNP